MSERKNSKKLSLIKSYLHKSAYFLIIASIIINIFPAIFTVIDYFLPGSAGGEYVVSTSFLKSFVASVCIIYYLMTLVPVFDIIFGLVTIIISVTDMIWRAMRGHRFNIKYFLLFIFFVILFVLAYMSRTTIILFFS